MAPQLCPQRPSSNNKVRGRAWIARTGCELRGASSHSSARLRSAQQEPLIAAGKAMHAPDRAAPPTPSAAAATRACTRPPAPGADVAVAAVHRRRLLRTCLHINSSSYRCSRDCSDDPPDAGPNRDSLGAAGGGDFNSWCDERCRQMLVLGPLNRHTPSLTRPAQAFVPTTLAALGAARRSRLHAQPALCCCGGALTTPRPTGPIPPLAPAPALGLLLTWPLPSLASQGWCKVMRQTLPTQPRRCASCAQVPLSFHYLTLPLTRLLPRTSIFAVM